ncbi:NAD-dependent dehydratase [Synergistales bacterium]|nr:NAD-dependent dehydratase [Synergistales bacterium]
MKILVTGAGGFIGSHLAEHLTELGHDVRAFVRYNSSSSWGWLDKCAYKNQIEIISGDIRDMDSVSRAVQGTACVFHLAALIGIPYSYVSPLAYIKTNAEGTYNVLESARAHSAGRVVCASTSEVYGTAQYVPMDEAHPINPQSPYAATKSAADYMALAYHKSFGLPVSVVRPFNTYGPRQSARAIIPTIASQLIAGKSEIALGSLTPTRDMNFVTDTARGFAEVGLHDKSIGRVTNLGTGSDISIGELAAMIAGALGVKANIVRDEARVRPSGSEVERLCSNAGAANEMGWHPLISLREGIEKTVAWIRGNADLFRTDRYAV